MPRPDPPASDGRALRLSVMGTESGRSPIKFQIVDGARIRLATTVKLDQESAALIAGLFPGRDRLEVIVLVRVGGL